MKEGKSSKLDLGIFQGNLSVNRATRLKRVNNKRKSAREKKPHSKILKHAHTNNTNKSITFVPATERLIKPSAKKLIYTEKAKRIAYSSPFLIKQTRTRVVCNNKSAYHQKKQTEEEKKFAKLQNGREERKICTAPTLNYKNKVPSNVQHLRMSTKHLNT